MSHESMIKTLMTEALGRFLDVDVARYKLVSTNLANVDTPGYRTRDLDFRAELRRATVADFAEENGFWTSASYSPVARRVSGLMEGAGLGLELPGPLEGGTGVRPVDGGGGGEMCGDGLVVRGGEPGRKRRG